MKRITIAWLAPAILILLVAVPARAEGYSWQPDQPDQSMCQDMTGNWVLCDSTGADGIGSGGGTVKTCTRSVCWFCEFRAGQTIQTSCGQTSVKADGPMGCDCGRDANGECDLKSSSCSIV